MAIESKDLIEYLGFKPEEVESLDDLKSKFSTDFIRKDAVVKDKDLVSQVTGKVIGSITTKLNTVVKDLGFELDENEIKGKKIEDVIGVFGNKAKDHYTAKITELESLASANNKDEAVKEWENKFKKIESKYNDTVNLLNTTKADYESKIQSYEGEKVAFKINHRKSEALKSVPFKDGLTELERKGYMSILDEEIGVELDETGVPYPISKKDKSRIPNPKVSGTFMDFEDLFTQKAIELKLAKVTPSQPPIVQKSEPAAPVVGNKKRVLASERIGFKPMGH